MNLVDLKTPSLILDRRILQRNCSAMMKRMTEHGVKLRPHMKTSKSAEVATLATAEDFRAITVSTLEEARYFADHGYRDITYAVGMVPDKVPQAEALIARGVSLTLLVDSLEAARGLADAVAAGNLTQPVLIEIDSGGGRAGLDPEDELLIPLGRFIHDSPSLHLAGVLTHAGHSYGCNNIDAIKMIAEQERSGVVKAAERLRSAKLPCSVVSAGSTPTAVHGQRFDGLTEMRPGVYVFFDLDQVGIGSCGIEDIALTVLTSVTGHNRRSGRILVDAGGLALSKDRSANNHLDKVGYGLICSLDSTQALPGLYIADVHQEHGLIASTEGEPPYDTFPIGSRLRILPNHACMTAAAHNQYHVVDGGTAVSSEWDRTNGW